MTFYVMETYDKILCSMCYYVNTWAANVRQDILTHSLYDKISNGKLAYGRKSFDLAGSDVIW